MYCNVSNTRHPVTIGWMASKSMGLREVLKKLSGTFYQEHLYKYSTDCRYLLLTQCHESKDSLMKHQTVIFSILGFWNNSWYIRLTCRSNNTVMNETEENLAWGLKLSRLDFLQWEIELGPGQDASVTDWWELSG